MDCCTTSDSSVEAAAEQCHRIWSVAKVNKHVGFHSSTANSSSLIGSRMWMCRCARWGNRNPLRSRWRRKVPGVLHAHRCGLLAHSADVLVAVFDVREVRLLLCGVIRVGVVKQVLNAEKHLPNCDRWLPACEMMRRAGGDGRRW